MKDLMKAQAVGHQVDTPSAPLTRDVPEVEVRCQIHRPLPAGLTVRRELWGIFRDGSRRRIATLDWPEQTTVTVHSETACRVWVHMDANQLVTLSETVEELGGT